MDRGRLRPMLMCVKQRCAEDNKRPEHFKLGRSNQPGTFFWNKIAVPPRREAYRVPFLDLPLPG
jgi:hypothetical protein